jgi:hypothetical protein
MKNHFLRILALVVMFWLFAISLSAGNPVAVRGDESLEPAVKTDSSLTDKEWGIKPLSLRQSAGGYMLDFRYRIIDPERASILLDRKIKPYLIDQATGTKLFIPNMPKVGSLKHTVVNPDVNKTYFMLFGNSRGLVKSGSKVTIVIGDFKQEDLVVE